MRAVRAVRDAWLGAVTFQTVEERIFATLKDYVVRHYHVVRDHNKTTTSPHGGWPYFYLPKGQVISLTRNQLLRAAGVNSHTKVVQVLKQREILKTNENGRIQADTPAAFKAHVSDGRMYLLHARPLLGELLDTFEGVDDLDVASALSHAAPGSSGVIRVANFQQPRRRNA